MDSQGRLKELEQCRLCPRNCGVDRYNTQGVCGAPAQVYAARAALHFWEEPCISGTRGSGAVFFSGCNLHCVYCQNREISTHIKGKEVTPAQLAQTFLRLQDQGAHNINLVTGTHYLPQIIRALELAKLQIPVVYNTSGYEKAEFIKGLEGLVDIYLPDFKYTSPERARKYSHAVDYPEVAKEALAEMVRQIPEPIFDTEGMMQKGVIVRHLLLPGGREDSLAVVKYLHETYGDKIYMSLMKQYTPLITDPAYPELSRKIKRREYERVVQYALDLGVENAFIQEGGTAKESFIPIFDGTGV
ncbi:MAG: radical SAM protein [Firmicutes bacterium]|nr:radical SAM protein [Bacillota bacterium]